MGCKIPDVRRFDNTPGVSEIIGAVLLITLVVAAVSVVAVILFSQPTPKEVPNLNFMTGMNTSLNTLYLYHNGGDPLNAGEFSVLVDGVPKAYTISGGGSQWSLGKNLIVPISPAGVPDRVQIIYNGSSSGMSGPGAGSGVVLREASSTNIVNSANISADQAPYLDCSAVKNWACADQIPPEIVAAQYLKNVSSKRIVLMKNDQPGGAVVANLMVNHLNFTVTDANSSITFGGVNCPAGGAIVPLSVGDKVSIYFNADPSILTLYGSGSQIWEMTAASGNNVRMEIKFTNGTVWTKPTLAAWQICHLYCGGYTNLDSTLVLKTDSSAKITALTVNNTVYLQGVSNTSVIQLNTFKPMDNGLVMITYTDTGPFLYAVGWADSITGLTPPLGL
jgi:hypothetical protein